MSYNLTLYNTSSANNAITKSLTQIQNLSIDFKEKNNNLQELDLIIYIANQSRVRLINYATMFYNGATLRYFVKIYPETLGNNRYNMHLTLDPLSTYKDAILALSVITERNTNKYNVYLPDSEQKITSQYKQFYHTFKGGDISHFKPHSSILCTLVGSE